MRVYLIPQVIHSPATCGLIISIVGTSPSCRHEHVRLHSGSCGPAICVRIHFSSGCPLHILPLVDMSISAAGTLWSCCPWMCSSLRWLVALIGRALHLSTSFILVKVPGCAIFSSISCWYHQGSAGSLGKGCGDLQVGRGGPRSRSTAG